MRYVACLLMVMAIMGISVAQTEPIPLPIPITSENIRQLRSVMKIDFADYPDILSGWFVVSSDGQRIAVRVGLNRMMIWEEELIINDFALPDAYNMLDVVFTDNNTLVIMDDSGQIFFYFMEVDLLNPFTPSLPNHIVQSVWMNDNGIVWMEALTRANNDYTLFSITPLQNIEEHPYAPATDPNALVRIGRVMPPYVVTSSPEGEVKLWHLETGEVLASADVGDVPAVFGQISPHARFLVWRDPMSQNLSLLDFDTGENRVVTALNGAYFQAFFVSDMGDVILGVDEEFEPRIVAWITAMGERVDLGEFRGCSRVPDMIRMSQDFTTLVIGCDTGLDIWRIVPESD